MRWLRVLRSLIGCVLLTGCHSGHPLIPSGWKVQAAGDPPAELQHQGRLQVIICYGAGLSNHAALRIESPGEAPLFWDPGGKFGTVTPKHERMRCLVLDQPPTIPQYWDFRTGYCGERWMEVFEWELPSADAARLREVLYGGRTGGGAFDPFYPGLGCAVGVSSFLKGYGRPRIVVDDSYVMPHSLAAHLWTQRPSRVWEFQYPQGVTVCTPP